MTKEEKIEFINTFINNRDSKSYIFMRDVFTSDTDGFDIMIDNGVWVFDRIEPFEQKDINPYELSDEILSDMVKDAKRRIKISNRIKNLDKKIIDELRRSLKNRGLLK